MIDYRLLADAKDFYATKGFTYIEVPWRVSTKAIDITKPVDAGSMLLADSDKALIASGEQGFLYLWMKGYLPPGKYMTITPCFRPEAHDMTHTKQFMKLELFDNVVGSQERLINHATDFILTACAKMGMDGNNWLHAVPNNAPLHECDIANSRHDLEFDGVEVGSFGQRKCMLGKWLYGTGVAEPRLSRLLHMVHNDK